MAELGTGPRTEPTGESVHDLREFHRFVGEKVQVNGPILTPEDVLNEWRILHPSPLTDPEEIEAIEEAFVDMRTGDRGQPLEDFEREFRARHNLILRVRR